jgi:NitT/TauT family transport system ATP-binding protein
MTTPEHAPHPDAVAVRVEDVCHYFVRRHGEPLLVADHVSFDVPRGQFVSLVGPSGCGKTTVLNMIAGLVAPTLGRVVRDGSTVTRPRRDVGYMFARDGLLPWRSAHANVELGLELRGIPARERRSRADELLDVVGLTGFGSSYPGQLSQGMRQRVALARTLSLRPDLLLMDEPFAALDAQTKLIVQEEFIKVWEGSGMTVIWVTHDLEEAVALSDRVIVFSARPGRIKSDSWVDLERPRNIEEVRFLPEFQEVHSRIWSDLRDEVKRAQL